MAHPTAASGGMIFPLQQLLVLQRPSRHLLTHRVVTGHRMVEPHEMCLEQSRLKITMMAAKGLLTTTMKQPIRVDNIVLPKALTSKAPAILAAALMSAGQERANG